MSWSSCTQSVLSIHLGLFPSRIALTAIVSVVRILFAINRNKLFLHCGRQLYESALAVTSESDRRSIWELPPVLKPVCWHDSKIMVDMWR
jgi:hypothetical protein